MNQASAPSLTQTFSYGTRHSLQTLDLTVPNPSTTPSEDQIFLVYIHGGAWRDPAQSSADFAPATSLILSDPDLRAKLAGIASINYGLSSYPSQPSDDASRNYKHPQHIQDVELALRWLWQHHRVGAKDGWQYMLVGHSCGATMALQVVAELAARPKMIDCIGPPRAVVGVEGIYDLELLVRNHADVRVYRDFVVGAFGNNETGWRTASPVYFGDRLSEMLSDSRVVTIAHSPEDELVEQEQADIMVEALKTASKNEGGANVITVALYGKHDEIWQKGDGLLRAISATLRALSQDSRVSRSQKSSVYS